MPGHTTPPTNDDLAEMAENALSAFPVSLARMVQGVSIEVLDAPDDATLEEMGLHSPWELTGLYRGTPVGQRSTLDPPRLPDRIEIYREPLLLEWIETGEDLYRLVRSVLVHEIAHHFGFSDDEIAQIDRGLK